MLPWRWFNWWIAEKRLLQPNKPPHASKRPAYAGLFVFKELMMIVLVSDFGVQDPYVGQMKAVLAREAASIPVIDLLHAIPDFNAHAGAHLLDAFRHDFQAGSVFLCVVDPGVGGARKPLVVEADGQWFVGPDNGLLSIAASRSSQQRYWHIAWQPDALSSSFHGRDLFAPIAAALALGPFPDDKLKPVESPEVQFDTAELPRVIYVDHYGNGWTGIRGGMLDDVATLEIKGQSLARRATFSEAAKGEAFWYINSVGLAEIAVNRGNAAELLGLKVGDVVRVPSAPARH
jgi:S-adenosylmethionine hydrolase